MIIIAEGAPAWVYLVVIGALFGALMVTLCVLFEQEDDGDSSS